MRARAGSALAAASLAAGVALAGCGGSGGADDPIAPVAGAVDPARVLENAQYPEIGADRLQSSSSLHTGHTTVLLSYVPGLRVDVEAAEAALAHFETLQQQVDLPVGDGGPALAYTVRPRNVANRYVIVVPEGAPLPRWAGSVDPGRFYSGTRPVNVDHVATVIRLGQRATPLPAPFDAASPAAQLDLAFLSAACAASTTVATDGDAAYRYGANIHNAGEGVVCTAESRQLAARGLGIPADRGAELAGAAPATATVRGGVVLGPPPFDPARYARLPRIGPVFALGS